MGGPKINSIFSGLPPSSILAPYMLTLSALHSFSQTLQPPASLITPHLNTLEEVMKRKEMRKLTSAKKKDLEKLHLNPSWVVAGKDRHEATYFQGHQ